MPSLFFDTDEIDATETGTVNKSGYLYVGRKYSGREATWITLKEKDIEELIETDSAELMNEPPLTPKDRKQMLELQRRLSKPMPHYDDDRNKRG